MRIAAAILAGALLGPALPARAQGEVTAGTVSPDVSIVTGLGANMAVLRTSAGLVAVDSLISPLHAREARRVIGDRHPGQTVKWLVNTHYHPDHHFGNQTFPEATIVAHVRNAARAPGNADLVAQMARAPGELETRLARLKEGGVTGESGAALSGEIALWQKRLARYAGFAPRPPDLLIESDATLAIGGKTIRLLHLGPGHTDGDLAVLFVEDRVLVTGDLVFNRVVPVIDTDGGVDVAGWIQALARLGELGDSVDRVIPGHGTVGGRELLAEQARYLGDLLQGVSAARRSGLTLEQAKRAVTLPAYSGYERVFGDVDGNVEDLWTVLGRRAGGKEPARP